MPILSPDVRSADGEQRAARALMRYDANKKTALIGFLLWFFLGAIGAHRFYLRRVGSGIVMLILAVVSFPLCLILIGYVGLFVLGIWMLVDAFLIPGWTRDYNNALIAELNV